MHTYNKLDSWLNNFLFVAIKKAWVALKPGGNMIIHIGDVNNYNIVSPMIKFMNKLDNSSNVMILGVGGNNRKIRKMYHICKRRS